MLPPIIIDEIKRREREERTREEQRPVVQVPAPGPVRPRPDSTDEEGSDRGVVIIDVG